MIPGVITNAIVWPIFICRLLQMPIGSYLWQVWGRTAIGLVPFVAANVLADRYWQVTTLWEFFLQVLATLPIAVAGIGLVYWADAREQLRDPGSVLRRHLPAARLVTRVGRLFGR
jgi:hypothetical protein